jgi:hypothetical protein
MTYLLVAVAAITYRAALTHFTRPRPGFWDGHQRPDWSDPE